MYLVPVNFNFIKKLRITYFLKIQHVHSVHYV